MGPDLVITITAHAVSDAVGEREYLLPKGTTDFMVDMLADAGIVVDQIDANLSEEA